VIDCSLYGDKSGICLHPTAAGQRNWAEAIEPTLSKMLGDKPKHDITAADVIKKFNIGADTGATNPTTRDASWLKTHQQRLEENSKKRVDLIFLGDSITNNWEKSGPAPDQVFQPIWQEFYGDRNAINLGYSGDRTQHVLWRLQHGEVDGMNPKAVVLMIGTNNTGHDTWQDVLAGDIAIVEELHRRLPNTKVLLLGIFPSDISPEKTVKDENINRVLSLIYAGSSYVTFLDIKNAFYKNGKLDTSIFYDPRLPKPGHALHPDTVGQRKWAEAIEPTLSRMLGDKNKLLK
jgi:lysophospholipase L1-like esterase